MNSDQTIPNDVYANLIQFPILVASAIVIPAIKRNMCQTDIRCKPTWRYDVYKITVSNVVGFSLLTCIAMIFQGSDLLNLYTLVAVDLTVGVTIDTILIKALRVGGMPIGYYGEPPEYTRFVWTTAIIIAVSHLLTENLKWNPSSYQPTLPCCAYLRYILLLG